MDIQSVGVAAILGVGVVLILVLGGIMWLTIRCSRLRCPVCRARAVMVVAESRRTDTSSAVVNDPTDEWDGTAWDVDYECRKCGHTFRRLEVRMPLPHDPYYGGPYDGIGG